MRTDPIGRRQALADATRRPRGDAGTARDGHCNEAARERHLRLTMLDACMMDALGDGNGHDGDLGGHGREEAVEDARVPVPQPAPASAGDEH